MLVELSKTQLQVLNAGLDSLVRNQGLQIVGQVQDTLNAINTESGIRKELERLQKFEREHLNSPTPPQAGEAWNP